MTLAFTDVFIYISFAESIIANVIFPTELTGLMELVAYEH
jgi:hypothetical protein